MGPASAQAQQFGGIDANALPAAPTPGTFQTLSPTRALEPGKASAGLRSTLLLQPLGGTLPSPSPAGTGTNILSISFVQEVLAGVGLAPGLDIGVALPFHLFQDGQGLVAIGVGERPRTAALGDPRITVGYALPIELPVRAYGSVFLPLGDWASFAGEANTRGELGLALEPSWGKLHLGVDAAFRLRETTEIAQTRWGSQLRLGLACGYQVTEPALLFAELSLAPTLLEQPSGTAGQPGYLLPAEVLAGVAFTLQKWRLAGALGTGLPLSPSSAETPTPDLRRGPTSPLLRLGLEARIAF